MRGGPALEVPVDAADGELETGAGGARHCLGLCLSGIFSCFSSSHLATKSENVKSYGDEIGASFFKQKLEKCLLNALQLRTVDPFSAV